MVRRGWRRGSEAAVLACALAASADAATLAGRLVAREGGAAVEGAVVTLVESGARTRTDAGGRFVFARVAPGLHTLSVRHVAWASLERSVRVPAGGDSVMLALAPTVYRTDEVIVRSTRATATLHASPFVADATGRDELQSRPAPTLPERLAGVPGLALVRDGAWPTAVSIRGMSRASVVALVDDARVETAHDLAGALSLVHPGDLERVEVMKSPGSVLFGTGALGGALHLTTRRARFSDHAEWGGEWTSAFTSTDGGTSHHAAIEHGGARHALRVSAGARASGDVRTPAGDLPNSSFRDWSGSAVLALRATGASSVTASYQRVQAEDAGIPGGAPFAGTARATYRLARRERFALEWAMPHARPWLPLATVRLAHQDIARDVEIVQSPTVLVTPHATHATTSAQIESRLLAGPRHVVIAGVEAWQRELDSRRERRLASQGRVIGERPVPRSAHLSAGVYVQDECDLAPRRVRVVSGARLDVGRMRNDRTTNPEWVTVNGVPQQPVPGQALLWPAGRRTDFSWSASSGLHAQLSPALAARALVATAYRAPSLEERWQYLDLGSSLRVGNPALRPEQSVSVGAGTRWQHGGTTLEGDAYVNWLTDLVADAPGTFQGRAALVKGNIGRARLHGFELAGSQRLGPALSASGTLAFVRGRDTRLDANLPQIAPLAGTFELSAVLGGAGTLRAGCDAAYAQRQVGTGEPTTPGWTAWHASFESRPRSTAGATWRMRAGVRNAFDRAYRVHLSTLRGVVNLEPGRSAWLSLTAGR